MKGGGKRKASASEPQNDSNDAEPSTTSGPAQVLGDSVTVPVLEDFAVAAGGEGANPVVHGDSGVDSVGTGDQPVPLAENQNMEESQIAGAHHHPLISLIHAYLENTRQESGNQNANGGNGGNSHNSHPRIMQLPFNTPVTTGWPLTRENSRSEFKSSKLGLCSL
ncbi:hypothetical protein PIB30_006517 [Stylosanthes scabra]|uniref:Uncharacterized protein n=1 Tax=Stylosanthes scabra TaxID=79078 RepID=A0ABU6W482_9FABA|nr:hypothetical protein [Stylosanthes scabra]